MEHIINKKITEWTKEERQELLDRIREHYPTGRIFLVGSRVFGGFHERSDLDFIVFAPMDELWDVRKFASFDFKGIRVKGRTAKDFELELHHGNKNHRKGWGKYKLILSYYDLVNDELWEGVEEHEQFRNEYKRIMREDGILKAVEYGDNYFSKTKVEKQCK